MTRSQLLQVARATGECLRTILDRGFSVFSIEDDRDQDETLLTLECPFCGRRILLSTDGPEGLPELAECDGCDLVFDYQADEVEQIPMEVFLDSDRSASRQLLYA